MRPTEDARRREEADAADRAFRRYLERPRRRRLAKVVEVFHRFVWDAAYRVTGNRADAADIAQDVFLKLLLQPPRSSNVRSPRGFLAWEVVGRAASLRRSADRRKAREKVAAIRAGDDGIARAGAASDEDLDALRTRVNELPGELRAAVELRYFAGLRNADVAQLLGAGERQVEKRLERARELLRSRMGPAAPALLLLDRSASDGCPVAPSSGPPASLRRELLKIASSGLALAIPLPGAALTAGGIALAKKTLVAAALAASLLLAGVAATRSFSSWRDSKSPRGDAIAASIPAPGPPAGEAPAVTATASSAPASPGAPGPSRGSVRGTVLDESGKPVEGVRISIAADIAAADVETLEKLGFRGVLPGTVESSVLTGATGEYLLTDLYPVVHRMEIEKTPYLPNWIPRPKVRLGEESKYDLILCLPVRLRLSVRTPEGDAVKGAQVFIGFDQSKHYYLDPSDPDPPHEHAFDVDDDGELDTGFGFVNFAHFCALDGRILAPGRELKGFRIACQEFKQQEARLEIVLAAERRLRVQVEDGSGIPVEGASVTCGNSKVHSKITDAAGLASLAQLPQSFSVDVSKEGYQGESIPSTVIDGDELRVRLRGIGPGISGQLTFDETIPAGSRDVSELFFYELGPDDRPVRALHNVRLDRKTNAFQSHPDGPLRFEVICDVGWRTVSRKPLVYDGQNPLRVDLHVRLEPPFLAGRVIRASTREGVSGAQVFLHLPWRDEELESTWSSFKSLSSFSFPRLPGNRCATTTAEDGSFLFLLSATDRYHAGSPLRRRAVLAALSDDEALSRPVAFDLDVVASTAVEDIELLAEERGAIEGTVIDEGGHPLPSALVAAFDGESVVKEGRADGSGKYRIDGLIPGRYLVELLGHAPYAIVRSTSGSFDAVGMPRPSEFYERPVKVESGETGRWDIDLRTDAPGSIEGVVPPELAGAKRASCVLLLGGRARGGPFGREADVRDGRFLLEGLHPGAYRVSVPGSELLVDVRRGPRTTVTMPVPSGSLAIPLEGIAPELLAATRVAEVFRCERYLADGYPVKTEVKPLRVERSEGRLRLLGLVSGSIEARILVPGFQALHVGPVDVSQDSEAVAPAVDLLPARSILVVLDLEAGLHPTGEPHFSVRDVGTGGYLDFETTRGAEGLAFTLSGLPDGSFVIEASWNSGIAPGSAAVSLGPAGDMDARIRLERERNGRGPR